MAYTDQRIGGNQRAAVMTIVALIQGAAIVALINGLAVSYFRPAPPPNPQSTDVPTTMPLPVEPPPPPKPPVERRIRTDDPLPRIPLGGPVTDDPAPPMPMPPGPLPTFTPEPPLPPPPPTPPAKSHSAVPRNAPGSWATPNDYPARDLREGNEGVARFLLGIGTDGRVANCTILVSSGFPGLDKATCDHVSRRARFEPAVDGSGNRVAGSYVGSIRWVIPD